MINLQTFPVELLRLWIVSYFLSYCPLVEEAMGKKPPYGILRYADGEFEVPYDGKAKIALFNQMEEMRRVMGGRAKAQRNHKRPNKCNACSYRSVCGEALEAG